LTISHNKRYYLNMRAVSLIIIVLALGSCAITPAPKTEVFTVDIKSPHVDLGEFEAQFDTLLGMGKIRKQSVKVVYYPKDDVVCLQYRNNLMGYNQFWSRRGRMGYSSALFQYNDDYSNRILARNEKKSSKKYGIYGGYLVWQQTSFFIQAKASMKMEIGYTFKDNSPYFTITQLPAEYIDELHTDNNRTSDQIIIYFTRAQAAELEALFESEIIGEYYTPPVLDVPSADFFAEDVPQKNTAADSDDY